MTDNEVSADGGHFAVDARLCHGGGLSFAVFGRPSVEQQVGDGATLLEEGFPFREVSALVVADRRSKDPVYGVHGWWARRPPALMRALLLASNLPAGTSPEDFWSAYGSAAPYLSGSTVLDPFMGGGSTLVEAARLGAHVVGTDVDPLAALVVRGELRKPDPEEFRRVADEWLNFLRRELAWMYPLVHGSAQPLHYFWLRRVTCPECDHADLLYRTLVLARSVGKPGEVKRDAAVTAFCPYCLTLHDLKSAERKTITCCGRRRRLDSATYRGHRYRCQACGAASDHARLRTGVADRVLVAIEETSAAGRRLREPIPGERQVERKAASLLLAHDLPRPSGTIPTGVRDGRPHTYGLIRFRELFSNRQLAVLGSALAWIDDRSLSADVENALRLAFSNSLTTNNLLCSYATDYGRLAPLFSVRGYALPALAVELNPLHDSGGRGTLAACVRRIERAAAAQTVRRRVWNMAHDRPERVDLPGGTTHVKQDVRTGGAQDLHMDAPADFCVFDPPYYDMIQYDELSSFHRAWLGPGALSLVGDALHHEATKSPEGFGRALGEAMNVAAGSLAPRAPLAFTYHSAETEAWEAVGIALDHAKLVVTGLWPLMSDGHMGHHSHEGNCEWDVVVVCRPVADTYGAVLEIELQDWLEAVEPLKVRDADRTNLELALKMAAPRFGRPWGETQNEE